MNVERQERKEAEREINSVFDEKVQNLRGELQQEKRLHESYHANTVSTFTDQISMLQGELFAERKNREETYDKIIKKIGNDVLKVNEILNTEKKVTIFFHFLKSKIDKRRDLFWIGKNVGRNASKFTSFNYCIFVFG